MVNPSPAPIELLLVDDEADFVSVLSKRLEKRGIRVTACLSGSDAVQEFLKKDFDVILLDLKMEFMDGIEVLKVVKETKPHIPVFMITGHGSVEEAQLGVDCGAVECLPKPYEIQDLLQKIQEAVSSRKESIHG
ncbi:MULTISPECIES: response regulator [Desulfococcus]|jgi:DNA-binding NtrC family response regulator|uniref:Response regulator receiver protein n=1 Tax=Desulfococcus multivorans DSM 2059 TaxID=1121405 RepID=S7V7C5_DESML|nr:response regulator [Desulfococcus multivorans]AOY58366.1 two component system response regulator [Desulfococcus multivorans]AQV00698.1 response regulator [Desulfococcus multivorans]EPR42559.1 response regulator receiver protein [Desulfococcus multivorans DSM 2059]MDX9818871.1 response regulator [Desulfococcus multivorans]SKA18717.1 Response regulator receiver domain-containing protein [Desulfococcus multivorans DSM 2059]